MTTPLHVLILEDNPSDAELVLDELRLAGFDPNYQRVDTEEAYLTALSPALDLILSDHMMPQFDSVRALQLLQEREWDLPFIIVSGSIGEDAAVTAMKNGVSDYLIKDRLSRLGEAVKQALRQKQLRDERRKAENALREREEYFRALIENGSDIISVTDADSTVRYVSPSVERVLGYKPDELIGHSMFAYVHPDDRAEAGTSLETPSSIPENSPPRALRVMRKDGSIRVLEFSASNQLANPSVRGIVTTSRDITERKQAEETLEDERNLLRTLIDAVPDYIYVKDTEGRYVLINTANLDLIPVSAPDDVVGKTDLAYFPPETAEQFRADDQRVIESGQPLINREESIVDVTGVQRWFLTTKVPLRDHHHKISGILGITRDITERKKAEAELLSAELLRAELAKEKELIELRERFIAMVSHDFRTPLTVILSSSSLLSTYYDRISVEKRLTYFQSIETQIKYMVELLDDVLLMDKTRSGKMQSEPTLIELIPFSQDILDLLQLTDTVGHQFMFAAEGSGKRVLIDENLLRRVLVNLLSNAIKYSPKGGEIHFAVAARDQELEFRISDQGIGIPVEDQKRLFEVFHRASNTGKISGTGLGLAIVKSSVDALGGTITCESKVGEGTTFLVRLPAVFK